MKQERPEMDDFDKEKIKFGFRGKMLKFLTDTPAKTSQNMFSYSFASDILKKNILRKKTYVL